MRKWVVAIAIAVALLGAAVIGTGVWVVRSVQRQAEAVASAEAAKEKAYQEAIIHAVNELRDAQKAAPGRARGGNQPNLKKLIASLKEIDTTKCPQDFQEAMLEFVQATERLSIAQRQAEGRNLVALGTALLTSNPMALAGLKSIPGMDEVIAARQKLETAALHNGVKLAFTD